MNGDESSGDSLGTIKSTCGLQNDYRSIQAQSTSNKSDHTRGSRQAACVTCGQEIVGDLGDTHWLAVDLARNGEEALEAVNQAVARIVVEVHPGMDIDG